MDFSYQDLQYIRNALGIYINHLKKHNEDDDDITEDEYSEMQDDIMMMSDLLGEVKNELTDLKDNATGGPKLEEKPKLRIVKDIDWQK